MKDILIINLTRMGDLLQTTPLMAGFKETYPDVKITLLVRSSFVEICRGISFIDDLIVFDMHGYRERLLNRKHGLVDNYRFIEELIEQINKKEYDLTMNLTHSAVSALITYLIRTKEIRGFTIDEEGHRIIKHPWLRYFFNVVPNRDYNPFHLVDMYIKAGGVMPERKGLIYEVDEYDEKKAEKLLAENGISKDDLLFGIHPGASKSDKTWPVSSFAVLADMITEEFGARILLFGSESEIDLGAEFDSLNRSGVLNLIGKTDIGELAALLKRCTLFVSNDTGPLHLATAVGTKVIDISTANAHFMETGPYGEGHYVIQADIPCVPCAFNVQCSRRVCKEIIKPEIVLEVAKECMGNASALSEDGPQPPKDIQVYRTHFEKDGFLRFYPLVSKPLRKEIIFRSIYREVWSSNLDAEDKSHEPLYSNVLRELAYFYTLGDIADILTVIEKDIAVLEGLERLAKEGIELSSVITDEARNNDHDVKRLKKTWECLESIDGKIEIIGHTNPCFRSLSVIYAYSKEALEGNGLLELADNTCRNYKNLESASRYMLQVMKKLKLFFESSEGSLNSRINLKQIQGTDRQDIPVESKCHAGIYDFEE